MGKETELSDIAISHISLVKAGANGKAVIYKSASEPTYTKEIKIAKQDKERGVVYGIVYSPNEVDSQGDKTSADEIQKAAYAFMKNRNTTNVDKDHDFMNKEAYIAESWILRKDDAVFPNEKEGSWAVAVQLESDALKEAVKKGEIAGLSMAGTAQRQEVQKASASETKTAIAALLDIFKRLNVSINGYVEKQDVKKEQETTKDLANTIKQLETAFAKTKEEENKDLVMRLEQIEEVLKSSKQDGTPNIQENTTNTTGGII